MTQTGTASASATLCSGKAVKVSRADLALIRTPERTTSFVPVPHADLVDGIEESLKRHSLSIVKQDYAVQNDGQKLYGVMVLASQTDEYSFAIGIRTSNDKTLAAQLIAAMQIFVCENGAFSGEPIVWRKHTSGLVIMDEINAGVDKTVLRFGNLSNRVEQLKALPLTDVEAKALVIDSVKKGVIAKTLIMDVVKEWEEPQHPEFEPRNMWSLHNSYTEVFKTLRPNIAMDNAIELGRMFAL